MGGKDRRALRFSRDRIVPEENNHPACGVRISWLPVEHVHPFGGGLHAPGHFGQQHYDKGESRTMPPPKLITTSASIRSKTRMTSSLIRLLSSFREYMIEYVKNYITVATPASWGGVPTSPVRIYMANTKDEIWDRDNNYIKSSHRTEITEWKFSSGRKKDWRHYSVFRPFCKIPAVSCQQPKSAKKLLIKIAHQRLTWNPQHELGLPVHTILQCFPPARKFRRRLHREDKKRYSKFRVDWDNYLSDRDNFNVRETKAPQPVRRWVLAEHVEAGAN